MIEAAKSSILSESLITNENLNTVVAATLHNIQPRAGDNIKDFTAINIWYQRLDDKYNFSLGPKILPLMNYDSLKQLKTLEAPFLKTTNQRTNNMQSTIVTSVSSKKNLLRLFCGFSSN